jgi:predicted kinase
LAERLAQLGSVQILSSDKLRARVYEKLFNVVAADRNTADLLILDATFFKKELRRQIKTLAQAEKVITVHVDCPLALALRRNRVRQPKNVFHRMEPPNHSTLRINTAMTTAADAAAKIFRFNLHEGAISDKRPPPCGAAR